MLKLIEFPGVSDTGDILVQAIYPAAPLVKTASAAGKVHPDTEKFISGLKSQAGKLYVLVNALGAGEWYGSNINGDYFEERELNPGTINVADLVGTPVKYGYETFLESGVFRHHVNKDVRKSFGKIVCAVYNPVMHRVELVIEVDRKRAAEEGHQDLVDQLDAGKNPAVSMGCRVEFDVCSICGNRSKTRNDYCVHAKTMMGQVLKDGRKVYVLNPRPRFFDLSFVVIGADRTSYAMAKVASVVGAPLSADLADEYGLRDLSTLDRLREKLAQQQKVSNLVKKLPALSAQAAPGRHDPDLPAHVLDRMAQHPFGRALTTAAAAGVVLKPHEYQRLALVRMGRPQQAAALAKEGAVFAPVSDVDTSVALGLPGDYDTDVRDTLLPYVPQRTAFDPFVSGRLERGGATYANPTRFVEDPVLCKIAAGYNGYREQLVLKMGSIVATLTSRDTKLLAALSNPDLEDMFADRGLAKSAAAERLPLALLSAIPLAFLLGAYRNGTGETTEGLRSFIDKHPVLATSILVGLARLGVGLATGGLGRIH